jgi:hypothetical protein
VSQAAAHEPGSYVLKGEGGAMEQFQGADIICDGHQGKGEVNGFGYDGLEVCLGDGVVYIRVNDAKGDLFRGEGGEVLEEAVGQDRDLFGEIESFIRSLSSYGGFFETYFFGRIIETIVFHVIKILRLCD